METMKPWYLFSDEHRQELELDAMVVDMKIRAARKKAEEQKERRTAIQRVSHDEFMRIVRETKETERAMSYSRIRKNCKLRGL